MLIAAIGNRWIDLADETGQRRIDNPLATVEILCVAKGPHDLPSALALPQVICTQSASTAIGSPVSFGKVGMSINPMMNA